MIQAFYSSNELSEFKVNNYMKTNPCRQNRTVLYKDLEHNREGNINVNIYSNIGSFFIG